MNLVRFGEYAMRSSEGFRILDQPLIANGPGVVLPIALAFLIRGVGLVQARVVAVAFALLAAGLFYTVAKRLAGTAGAIVAILLLIAIPSEGFLVYGRHALGVVPALVYFLGGYLAWLISLERSARPLAVASGVLFGLAAVTKGQYLILVPVLGAAALIAERWLRAPSRRGQFGLVLLTMVLTVGAWIVVQRLLVGGGYADHLQALASSTRVTILALRPDRIPGNIWYLVRSGILLAVLPGLVYVGLSMRRWGPARLPYLPLLILVVLWLGWYAFVSVGFPRYAFEPYVAGLLLTGKLADDSFLALMAGRRRQSTVTPPVPGRQAATIVMVGLSLLALGGLVGQVRNLATSGNAAALKLAAFMQAHVEPGAVVESWEWELDPLADLTYHHPTNDWVDRYTALLQFNEPLAATYDPGVADPQYLIDGPFSKWTGLYDEYLAQRCCALILAVEPYDLYEVR
jgi:hypothetical protein